MRADHIVLRTLGLALVLAGCNGTTAEATFLISAKITPSAFRAGDTAVITVTYTNGSNLNEPLDWTDCPLPWIVQSGSVTWAPNVTDKCELLIGSVTMTPGAQQSFTFLWTGASRTDTTGLPASLSAGTYTLQGRPQAEMNPYLNFQAAAPVTFQILP